MREGRGLALFNNDKHLLLATVSFGIYIISVEDVKKPHVVSRIELMQDAGKILQIKQINKTNFFIGQLISGNQQLVLLKID